MRSVIALVRREFLEHKGAFLFAPLVLLAIFAVAIGSAVLLNETKIPLEVTEPSALRFFETAFVGMGVLWFIYLMAALFFYYADAFSADRRNNSMLFWKSMPVSDFTILMSKMLAGMTLFPALIFLMLLATGLALYAITAAAVASLPMLQVPGIGEVAASTGQVALFSVGYLALALLWYAPFFAWVGALSTVVGRWSIPLAFLIPGLAVIGENLFFRGIGSILGSLLLPNGVPSGGYILDFLGSRVQFGFDRADLFHTFATPEAFSATSLLAQLAGRIDWAQMAAGIAAAVVLVWLASEYRRRIVVA